MRQYIFMEFPGILIKLNALWPCGNVSFLFWIMSNFTGCKELNTHPYWGATFATAATAWLCFFHNMYDCWHVKVFPHGRVGCDVKLLKKLYGDPGSWSLGCKWEVGESWSSVVTTWWHKVPGSPTEAVRFLLWRLTSHNENASKSDLRVLSLDLVAS